MTVIRLRTATGWQDLAVPGPTHKHTLIGGDEPSPRNDYVAWIDTDEPESTAGPTGPAGGALTGSYPNPTLAPAKFAAVRGWDAGVQGLSPIGTYRPLKGGAYEDADLDITGGPAAEVWEFQAVVIVRADTAAEASARLRIYEVNTATEVAVSYVARMYWSTGGLSGRYSVMLTGIYTIPALAVRKFQVQAAMQAGSTGNLGGGKLENCLVGRCVTVLGKGPMTTPAGGLADIP